MTYPKHMVLDPGLLKPNPWNTNILTPENEAKLEASIKRLGFFRPAVVREIVNSRSGEQEFEILGGEHRIQVAAKLGIKASIINLGPIDDLKAKEIGMVDNARYGVDDSIALAELIKEMGNSDQLTEFLPYTENEFVELFASTEIDLDGLDLDENFEREEENAEVEPISPKAPKTHTIIRFKISNRDAEDLTRLIEATKQAQGFTSSDELTNAGDALVHLLLSAPAAQPVSPGSISSALDDLDDLETAEDE